MPATHSLYILVHAENQVRWLCLKAVFSSDSRKQLENSNIFFILSPTRAIQHIAVIYNGIHWEDCASQPARLSFLSTEENTLSLLVLEQDQRIISAVVISVDSVPYIAMATERQWQQLLRSWRSNNNFRRGHTISVNPSQRYAHLEIISKNCSLSTPIHPLSLSLASCVIMVSSANNHREFGNNSRTNVGYYFWRNINVHTKKTINYFQLNSSRS